MSMQYESDLKLAVKALNKMNHDAGHVARVRRVRSMLSTSNHRRYSLIEARNIVLVYEFTKNMRDL